MADIVIINPRFDISFWGLEHCMPLFGKRANLPVACLGLLAALVPEHHGVTLIMKMSKMLTSSASVERTSSA